MKRIIRSYYLINAAQKYAEKRNDSLKSCASNDLKQQAKDNFLRLAELYNRTINRINKLQYES